MLQRIASFFIMIFYGLAMAVGVLLAPFESNEVKIAKEFDDGSKIISDADYPASFHHLYGNIGIFRMESACNIKVLPENLDLNDSDKYFSTLMNRIHESLSVSDTGYYVKYSFSDSGYIAFYDYDKESCTGDYYVYSVSEGKVTPCESMTQVYDYAADNHFTLGEWYFANDSIAQEKEIVRMNDWSVCTTSSGMSAVRNGYEDMFAGEIKTYACDGDFLAFHIRIREDMQRRLRPFDNPILPHNDESEPIDYTFFWKTPIYCDRYIVINTTDDSYQFFDKKSEVNDFFQSNDIHIKWQKIKF